VKSGLAAAKDKVADVGVSCQRAEDTLKAVRMQRFNVSCLYAAFLTCKLSI